MKERLKVYGKTTEKRWKKYEIRQVELSFNDSKSGDYPCSIGMTFEFDEKHIKLVRGALRGYGKKEAYRIAKTVSEIIQKKNENKEVKIGKIDMEFVGRLSGPRIGQRSRILSKLFPSDGNDYCLFQCPECKAVDVYPLNHDVKCPECVGARKISNSLESK
jgi:hypothetical protein